LALPLLLQGGGLSVGKMGPGRPPPMAALLHLLSVSAAGLCSQTHCMCLLFSACTPGLSLGRRL